MRSELNNFENIDKYISGEMSVSERSAFESQMAGDPALKSLVKDQQLFIQSVSRKALMSEINSVALTAAAATTVAGSSGFFGGTFWVVTSVLVVGGGTTAGLVYFNQDDDREDAQIALVGNGNASEEDGQTTVNFTPLVGEDAEIVTAEADDDRGPSRVSFIQPGPVSDPTNYIETNPVVDETGDVSDNLAAENSGLVITDNENTSTEFDGDNRTAGTVNARINGKAEFTGGIRSLSNFLKKNVTYPGTARSNGIEAVVEVKFWVDQEGKIDVIEIHCSSLYDAETNKLLDGVAGAFKADIRKTFEEKVRHTMSVMNAYPWQPETDTYGNPMNSLQTWNFRFDIQQGILFYPTDL